MLFNSLTFFIFLPAVFAGYWWIGERRWQNAWLLTASYVFYGWWDWRFLFLIAGCSAINFWAGGFIARTDAKWKRRAALVFCVAVCIGTLGVFKYHNFFAESLCALFGWSPASVTFQIVLPVGISFFTFQALSYTIDIARGKLEPAKSWIEFFTFIAFFPQLVAGPIERAANLLPQFQKDRRFSYDAALHGLSLMAYGLFKKMVVADTLASYVDNVFDMPELFSSVTCMIAMVFFSLQIYCDFSGYSDVARGVARLFGFDLMVNFNRPYLSKSFGEFWRNWHISLSTWFRDYVYIPLGGSRVAPARWMCNTMVVFLLSGLWHGAAWTFVIWGGIHGVFLTMEGICKRFRSSTDGTCSRTGRLLRVFWIDFWVAFAWIFFRAGSFDGLSRFLKVLFSGNFQISPAALFALRGRVYFLACILSVALLAFSYVFPRDCRFVTNRGKYLYILGCMAVIVLFAGPSGGEFIYFRF